MSFLEHKSEIEQKLEQENWQMVQFKRLGLDEYEALCAAKEGTDYHDVEAFLQCNKSCSPQMAVRIVR